MAQTILSANNGDADRIVRVTTEADMTAAEIYESVTNGGSSDFAELVTVLNRNEPWCLIGGLAVNCYVEPVYTVDVDLVMVAATQRQVLGLAVPVASLQDIVRDKVWAWQDEQRRSTKRKKDELDLMRIAEAHQELRRLIPAEIVKQL